MEGEKHAQRDPDETWGGGGHWNTGQRGTREKTSELGKRRRKKKFVKEKKEIENPLRKTEQNRDQAKKGRRRRGEGGKTRTGAR